MLVVEPQYASDTSQDPGDYTTEEDASLESSSDEDNRTTPENSKSTPPSSAKSSSSSKYLSESVTNQSNHLRRRRFLIFDKLPPRGFKRLKPKVEDNSTTSTTSAKYKLGDGFSQDEAKPNGLVQLGFHLRTKRKALHVESKVGALDLTQSSFTSSPKKQAAEGRKKKTITKKRVYDNSFLPDPKRAERQRKRQKLLKKKDNPLQDKEMLPPRAPAKPKIILTSAILGEHAHLAEKARPSAAAGAPEHEQGQIRSKLEGPREKDEADVPLGENEEGEVDSEELVSREPSIELGESPVKMRVLRHSAAIHQHDHPQQHKPTEEHREDPVEVLSEEVVKRPVQEPTTVQEPAQASPDQPAAAAEHSPRELPGAFLVENPLKQPSKKPLDAQEQLASHVHAEGVHPRPTVIKESASAKPSNPESSSTRGTKKNTIHTTQPPKFDNNGPSRETYHSQSQSQKSSHRKDQDHQQRNAPASKDSSRTSPGSSWETYISETDIHAPTPPKPLSSRGKSLPSVSSSVPSCGSKRRSGLGRSNSAV